MSSGTPLTKVKSSRDKDDIGQNIQVFARCRPLNQAERDKKSFSIVEIPNAREIVVKEKPNSNMNKSYQFDRVFGPKSVQLDVYKAVVQPLIDQVLMGYNCTVFAYGQTGTGKTFTMEGGDKKSGVGWESDPTSGIIPRALAQILDTLREQADNLEYSVKLSFLELYNEEIFDLLSGIEDTSKLRLYEDAYKKGSVIIQGLGEVQVLNKAQVYSILEKGSEKRKTAETKMNAQSSRSHTVFTVTVHIKEGTLEEEVLRIGKLNLVDLAGAENIGKSGAKDGRAREAGNINQSLLTLGRVITNLVERAPHIPYRESKLTRLLQDSLGGRTKTSIIATISPATINLEETLSTLDYASRARSILNRPEVNAKLTKEELVKEYSKEMDRIRRDMLQLRDANGIYIAHENYRYMMDKVLENEMEIKEKTTELIALKAEMDKKKNLFNEVEKNMIYKSREIQRVKEELEAKESKLIKVNDMLRETVRTKDEQEHLVSKQMETEMKLNIQARKLQSGCDDLGQDLGKLQDKLEIVNEIESGNDSVKDTFLMSVEETLDKLASKIEKFSMESERRSEAMIDQVGEELTARQDQINELISMKKKLLSSLHEQSENSRKKIEEDQQSSQASQKEVVDSITKTSQRGRSAGENYVAQISPSLNIIEEKVKDQAKCLQTFSDNIQSDFSLIKSSAGESVDEIVKIVRDIELKVKTHFGEEEKAFSALNGINDQNVASQDKFKKAVDGMMNVYQEHYNHIEQLNVEAKDVMKELAKQNASLKGSVEDNVFKLTTDVDDLEKTTNVQVEEAEKKTRSSVEESEEICETMKGARKNLKTSSGRFFKESIENVDNSLACLEKENSNRKEAIENNQILSEKNSESAKRGYEDSKKVLVSKIDEETKSSIVEELGALSKLSKEEVAGLIVQTMELDEEVSSLVWEKLKVYQPTGATPVRTERHYPRFLAATESHKRILEKFRKTVETEDCSMDSESSYNLENENKPESFGHSSKREIKKPEVLKKILRNSNQ